ncbi:MAG: hypothetical protein HN337_05795 [Deltaproteobacteria bacterium]|jgi:tetratricopeptide (TPR) repeat protein|nr:hypothetical protein [Deltaproteobacteria bacterium]
MNIKWWQITIFVALILIAAAAIYPTNLRTGWMFQENSEFLKALTSFGDAVKKNPNDYRAIRQLAETLQAVGRIDEAGELYERMIEIRESEKNYSLLVKYYIWSEQPQKLEKAYEGWFKYREILGITFNDNEGKQLLRDLYTLYIQEQEFEKALETLKEIRKYETADEAHRNFADLISLYEKTDNLKMVVKLLRERIDQGIATDKQVDKFVNLAKISGNETYTKSLLIKDVKANPEDDFRWKRLVDFQTRLKEFNLADHWYQLWMKLKPKDEELKKTYIDWLMYSENENKAIEFIKKVLKEGGSDPFFKRTLVELYEWNNVQDELLPIYRKRFQKNPHDRENADKLLSILYDKKMNTEAESVLRRLASAYPGNLKYAEELSGLQYQRKDEPAAISTLERTATITENPTLLKKLGEHYMWSDDDGPKNVVIAKKKKKKKKKKNNSKNGADNKLNDDES